MKYVTFFAKIVWLAVFGAAFSAGGAFLGGRIIGDDSAGFGALGLAIIGMLVGFPIGTVISLLLLKKLFHQRGSIWLGILGAFMGTLVLIGLTGPLHLNENSWLLVSAFCIVVPAATLFGFHLKKS